MAAAKSSALAAVAGFIVAVLTWVWLAGGTQARTATRLDDHEKRLTKVEQIQSDLAEIKATLKAMQAEQRILHGKPDLGR